MAGVPAIGASQAPPICSPPDDLRVSSVVIMALHGRTGTPVAPDTIWVPAEGLLSDELFVDVGVTKPRFAVGDSAYVAVSLELLLRGPGDSGYTSFTSGAMMDTLVPVPESKVTRVGPFATRRLIPWPGIAVEATANALPTNLRARAWALMLRRGKGRGCLEPLRNNVRRSRTVVLEYAY